MNINYKEPQFELFPANSATLEDINKPRFLLASLTLSTENLVILLILAIMIGLFSYSIGVEVGRSLAAKSLDEKAAAAWNVGGRRLAVTSPAVSTPVVKSVARPTNKVVLAHAGFLPRTTFTTPKASVVKAEPSVVAPTMVGSKWTVQIATYKNEKYAQQEALGLKTKGFPVFLVRSKDFYLVCVGQFASQVQADAFAKRIQAKNQSAQVRRI